MNLTESRITQITALLGLAPEVQERLLLGEAGRGIRDAIRKAREVEWQEQNLTWVRLRAADRLGVPAR